MLSTQIQRASCEVRLRAGPEDRGGILDLSGDVLVSICLRTLTFMCGHLCMHGFRCLFQPLRLQVLLLLLHLCVNH